MIDSNVSTPIILEKVLQSIKQWLLDNPESYLPQSNSQYDDINEFMVSSVHDKSNIYESQDSFGSSIFNSISNVLGNLIFVFEWIFNGFISILVNII